MMERQRRTDSRTLYGSEGHQFWPRVFASALKCGLIGGAEDSMGQEWNPIPIRPECLQTHTTGKKN